MSKFRGLFAMALACMPGGAAMAQSPLVESGFSNIFVYSWHNDQTYSSLIPSTGTLTSTDGNTQYTSASWKDSGTNLELTTLATLDPNAPGGPAGGAYWTQNFTVTSDA
jgi:hypothetical protein